MNKLIAGAALSLASLVAPAVARADVFVPAPPIVLPTPSVGVRFGFGGGAFGRPPVVSFGYHGGGYNGGGYARNGGGGYVSNGYGTVGTVEYSAYGSGGRWHHRPRQQDPNVFVAQIERELASVDNDLRYDVSQGGVSPDALPALAAGRQEIEHDLQLATQKGYITPDDRAHLEGHVQEMRDLRTQYAVNVPCSDDNNDDEQ